MRERGGVREKRTLWEPHGDDDGVDLRKEWISPRVARLTETSEGMGNRGRSLGHGSLEWDTEEAKKGRKIE